MSQRPVARVAALDRPRSGSTADDSYRGDVRLRVHLRIAANFVKSAVLHTARLASDELVPGRDLGRGLAPFPSGVPALSSQGALANVGFADAIPRLMWPAVAMLITSVTVGFVADYPAFRRVAVDLRRSVAPLWRPRGSIRRFACSGGGPRGDRECFRLRSASSDRRGSTFRSGRSRWLWCWPRSSPRSVPGPPERRTSRPSVRRGP